MRCEVWAWRIGVREKHVYTSAIETSKWPKWQVPCAQTASFGLFIEIRWLQIIAKIVTKLPFGNLVSDWGPWQTKVVRMRWRRHLQHGPSLAPRHSCINCGVPHLLSPQVIQLVPWRLLAPKPNFFLGFCCQFGTKPFKKRPLCPCRQPSAEICQFAGHPKKWNSDFFDFGPELVHFQRNPP